MNAQIFIPSTLNVGILTDAYTEKHAKDFPEVDERVSQMRTMVENSLRGLTWVKGEGVWVSPDGTVSRETVYIAHHFYKRHDKQVIKKLVQLATAIAIALNQWCVTISVGNHAYLVSQDGTLEKIGD